MRTIYYYTSHTATHYTHIPRVYEHIHIFCVFCTGLLFRLGVFSILLAAAFTHHTVSHTEQLLSIESNCSCRFDDATCCTKISINHHSGVCR